MTNLVEKKALDEKSGRKKKHLTLITRSVPVFVINEFGKA